MEKTKSKNFKLTLFIFLLIAVSIAWFLYWYLIDASITGPSEQGQFGDKFGGINALFSGFAFAGIIYTILMQREELRMQREELALQRQELQLTRQELKKAAEAQEKSEKALSKQAESMLLTAKLNGLHSLLAFQTSLMEQNKNNQSYQRHVDACQVYADAIRSVLQEIAQN